MLPWALEQQRSGDKGCDNVLATYFKWEKRVEEHRVALTGPKNTEGGVSTKPVDASNHRKKYLPFSHVMKLFWRCPIVFDTVPCSLRDARRNVASKYARWCLSGCPPTDGAVLESTEESVPVEAGKTVGSVDCCSQNRNQYKVLIHPDHNVAQKDALHGGREVGVGGVDVMQPRCERATEISAENVPSAPKSIGDFITTVFISVEHNCVRPSIC